MLIGCVSGKHALNHVREDSHIPKSIAQIPVPVPTSSAFLGFSMGEKYSLLLKVKHST